MAKDDEDFKTRRRREEKEEDARISSAQEAAATVGKIGRTVNPSAAHGDDPEVILKQIEPLLEQLNNLYVMYLSGLEKRPPVEKRALVDSLMQRLTTMSKSSVALRFKVSTVSASYLSHRDRWDKMLKAKEKQ